jgi:preprotein translocase subunit SecF
MLRFFANAHYDFISVRRYAYAITALFILPGLLFLLFRGLNYSIEFTGGTLIQVQSRSPTDVAAVRAGLDRQGIHGAEIQNFGAWSGRGWPRRAPTRTTPRPRRTPCSRR